MSPVYDHGGVVIYQGDCRSVLDELPEGSVNCCVTSPPYWGLRDYGVEGQLGLEETPEAYTEKMVEVFREVKRVLRDDGTVWLNLGDSYTSGGRGDFGFADPNCKQATHASIKEAKRAPQPKGLKPKDLVGIPWRVAFALQADGWYLRQDIIWHKPSPMPESVQDRCTKAHEYIFLLSKNAKYYYDHDAIKEQASYSGSGLCDKDSSKRRGTGLESSQNHIPTDTRNKRSVWTVTTKPYKHAHFATFPPDLIKPCILAGCPEGGTVLDPFCGSGTTAQVAKHNGRRCVGVEMNPDYIAMIKRRVQQDVLF